MASTSMLALLNDKFAACLIKGTSVRESGLTVSTETFPGETILFFHTDCDEGRQNLNMISAGLKICDYLILYTKDSEPKEIVCFLELKGKKLEDAIRQVLSTRESLQALAIEEINRKHHQYITWKVCICLHGHAPRPGQHNIDELIKKFGKNNILIKHGMKQYKLLGSFLREQTM
ncbi:MAG: hypothetical protein ACRDHW_03995 [Ktedonobacteraceae bacterium]